MLTYAMRLRAIEVDALTLTDASALMQGIRSNRCKVPRHNATLWTKELRAAVR
ncbi:TPA: hypothetical protein ACGRQA_002417 [Stenotrophomonas maltophilia]|uniref:hypothetical protein n=1 Tax=Stenotrophomonas maltophilia TaxID=40324 RepID=UPI0013DD15B0|nr:hypothetical protein [Stenotrophomonas maltophilia]